MNTMKVYVAENQVSKVLAGHVPEQYWTSKPYHSPVVEMSITLETFAQWQVGGKIESNTSSTKKNLLRD